MTGFVKKIRIILVACALLFPFGLLAEEASSDVGERESCVSARTERKELCDQAALHCVEVHKYEALNKIRACAHYSLRCSQAGSHEDDVCFPSQGPRVGMRF